MRLTTELRADVGWDSVEGFGGSEGACEVDVEVVAVGVEVVCGATPPDDIAPAAVDFISHIHGSLKTMLVCPERNHGSPGRLLVAPAPALSHGFGGETEAMLEPCTTPDLHSCLLLAPCPLPLRRALLRDYLR